jgi:hypothetical protein
MADPVTLFILVAAGERSDLTRAMVGATHDALGASALVVVREVSGDLSDVEALATERGESADAVVELSWTDSRHQQASLRIHIAEERRWVERTIGFLRSDADSERGRTLGFAIASILPQTPSLAGAASAHAAAPSPPTGGSPEPAATAAAPTSQSPRSDAPPVRPSDGISGPARLPWAAIPPQSPPDPMQARRLNLAVDTLARAVGIGGNASAVGGEAALQWFPLRSLSLRLGAGLQGGAIYPASANTLTVFACAGVVLHLWRASVAHPFGASLRAEGLLVDESLTYFGPAQPSPTTVANRFPGLGLVADVSWRFAPDVELVAGGGMEDVFVSGYVDIGPVQKATLSPLNAVAEAGLRLDL